MVTEISLDDRITGERRSVERVICLDQSQRATEKSVAHKFRNSFTCAVKRTKSEKKQEETRIQSKMKSLLIVLVACVAQAQSSGGMYAYTRATTVGSFSQRRPLSAFPELGLGCYCGFNSRRTFSTGVSAGSTANGWRSSSCYIHFCRLFTLILFFYRSAMNFFFSLLSAQNGKMSAIR